MPPHRTLSAYLILVVVCLVPMAALGAAVLFNTPLAPTGLIAMLILIPLARRLLAMS